MGNHQANLRDIAEGRMRQHLTQIQIEGLLNAADHIDAIEANNKILNRVMTIDHEAVEAEQVKALSSRVTQLESKLAGFSTVDMYIEDALRRWGVINANTRIG